MPTDTKPLALSEWIALKTLHLSRHASIVEAIDVEIRPLVAALEGLIRGGHTIGHIVAAEKAVIRAKECAELKNAARKREE